MRNLIVGFFLALMVTVSSSFVHAAVPVEVKINSPNRAQGDVLAVRVSGMPSAPTGNFIHKALHFFPYSGGWIALAGVPVTTNPGTYLLEIVLENDKIMRQPIRVNLANFKASRLTVSESQAKLANPGSSDQAILERKQKDQKLIEEAYSKQEPQPLWNGAFIRPVEGRVTTEYGYSRYVNGVITNQHLGIDIANSLGTPILAVNDGIVRLAENLLETGHTIIIDHGAGVFSSYSHLSKMQVKAGDLVYRSQTIGKMGSTGFSTGSHLHWVMRVGEVYLNPTSFIGTNLFQDVRITLY